MTGDARAAVARLRVARLHAEPEGLPWMSVHHDDLAALLAEHDRLAAADPVAVVARVDLEGVLAGHEGLDWSSEGVRCVCGWLGDDHPAHQAERVRAAVAQALRGGGA